MALKWKRDQILKLITCVEQHPCIYNVKSVEYLDRLKKAQAFNNILTELLKMDSAFSFEEIKRKWRNLRTQYCQELRAVYMSKRHGDGTKVYIPKLWCIDQLHFLKPHVEIKASKEDMPVTAPIIRKKKAIDPDELLELATKRLKRIDDYSQTVANVWASEFRLVSDEQKFFAKKAIDDILFEARLGTLHRNSVKINCEPETFNANDATLQSPVRCLQNQYQIVHLPNDSQRSCDTTDSQTSSLKCENYNQSYPDINETIQ